MSRLRVSRALKEDPRKIRPGRCVWVGKYCTRLVNCRDRLLCNHSTSGMITATSTVRRSPFNHITTTSSIDSTKLCSATPMNPGGSPNETLVDATTIQTQVHRQPTRIYVRTGTPALQTR
ncbi:hypothetical protein C8Q78DRAFT_415152 [Trametes maxima]|nr:hypothetical protein C8Q78DRAFT_415152 [Trametes maxima]